MIAALLCAVASWVLLLTIDSVWVGLPCPALAILGSWFLFGGGEHWLLRRGWATYAMQRRHERDNGDAAVGR